VSRVAKPLMGAAFVGIGLFILTDLGSEITKRQIRVGIPANVSIATLRMPLMRSASMKQCVGSESRPLPYLPM
jgi:hypothetical protein